jgi:glutamyl-tRNA reductase
MEELVIINRSPNEKPFQNGLVWTTCLRQILFTTNDQLNQHQIYDSDSVLSSTDAVAFLAEVLCGLKSPVFGETEVFGQFKIFLDLVSKTNQPVVSSQTKWVRFLFELVKNLRTDYIKNTGSNSYGSTLRKLTRDVPHLSIIGAGQLATEILPWISKNKSIQLHVRNTEKYEELSVKFPAVKITQLYSDTTNFDTALIVAAPIDNADLITSIERAENKPEFIYDLRATGFEELRQNLKNIKMLSLSDFFEIFNEDKVKFDNLKIKISQIIKQRCEDYSNRSEIRPLGWDDLCL